MPETDKIRVETNGPVTTITINRPERRNALDLEATDLLTAAFAAFENDPEAQGAVLQPSADGRRRLPDPGSIAMGGDQLETESPGQWRREHGPDHRPYSAGTPWAGSHDDDVRAFGGLAPAGLTTIGTRHFHGHGRGEKEPSGETFDASS